MLPKVQKRMLFGVSKYFKYCGPCAEGLYFRMFHVLFILTHLGKESMQASWGDNALCIMKVVISRHNISPCGPVVVRLQPGQLNKNKSHFHHAPLALSDTNGACVTLIMNE